MTKAGTSTQQDLFEEPPPSMALAPAERAKALEQLQTLLVEALETAADRTETGDEQDHV
jgi:hypothetical protein